MLIYKNFLMNLAVKDKFVDGLNAKNYIAHGWHLLKSNIRFVLKI